MIQQEIYIFGAGGLGREAYCVIKTLPQYKAVAFVENDDFDKNQVTACGEVVPVIKESEFAALCGQKTVSAVIGIGSAKARQAIATKFLDQCNWPNIIHPSVIQTGVVELGVGNFMSVNCIFSDNIKIGDFNLFNSMISVGHDVVMGDCNVVMPSVNISGGITIGNGNMLGAKVFLLQGITVGNGNTIGAGSVVLRKVGDDTTLFGVPAKKIEI